MTDAPFLFDLPADARTKRCTNCDEVRPYSEYRSRGRSRPGVISWCASCQKDYAAGWYQKNRDRLITEYWENIDDRRAYARSRILFRKYGITPEQYDSLLAAQGGVCPICGGTGGMSHMVSPLVVDHDHETGEVRGLLCALCNMGLGHFRDEPEYLRNAIAYLVRGGSTA